MPFLDFELCRVLSGANSATRRFSTARLLLRAFVTKPLAIRTAIAKEFGLRMKKYQERRTYPKRWRATLPKLLWI